MCRAAADEAVDARRPPAPRSRPARPRLLAALPRRQLHRAIIARPAAQTIASSRRGVRAGRLGRGEVGEEADRGRARAGDDRQRARRPRERRERLGDLGPQRDRGRLEVVDEQLGVVERRGAGAGRLRAAAPPARRAPPALPAEPQPVGLGVDLGGRRARRRRGSARPRARPAPAAARPARRRPPTSASAGSSCEGTSAPSPAASSGERRRPRRAASRSTAAASALPPPSPAATGIRFSISTRSGAASQPRSRSAASAPRGQVLALDARADDLVALRLGVDLDPVGERERREQRAELVQAVLAPRPDVEAEVELRRGAQDHARPQPLELRRERGELLRRQRLGARVRRQPELRSAARAGSRRARPRRARASAPATCAGGRRRRGPARASPASAPGPVRRRRSSAESTRGRGVNTAGSTVRSSRPRRRAGRARSARRRCGSPAPARSRSAISRWTITVHAASVGSSAIVRRISGVAIE